MTFGTGTLRPLYVSRFAYYMHFTSHEPLHLSNIYSKDYSPSELFNLDERLTIPDDGPVWAGASIIILQTRF